MVLHGIDERQPGPQAVCQHQAIACGAIVIGSGDPLIMQSPAASCGNNDRFCLDKQMSPRIQVFQHCPRGLTSVIQEKLNGWTELPDADGRSFPIVSRTDLIPQRAHDLCAGVIAGSMHALAAGAPTMDGAQGAVRLLIEHDPQRFEPGDDLGGIGHQGLH